MRAQRLSRSLTDRVVGGVCGGFAQLIGINAWWVRVIFAVLGVFTAGTGLLLYLALWLILPPQRLASLSTGPDHVYARSLSMETVVVIGLAVIGMGLIVLARNLGLLQVGSGDVFAPLVVIVFGLVFLVKQVRRTA